jgi:ribosome recycling factor
MDELLKDADQKIQKAIKATAHELAMVRTGRANPALLDRVTVETYGTSMPLNQVANVSVSDATTILIRPFDKGTIGAIEKAIQKSDLGLTPQSDGTMIRLNIPPLTRERRQEMVKMIKGMVEEGKVQVRNIRRDFIEKLRKMEKSKEINEDDVKSGTEKVQKLTDKGVEELDSVFKKKEQEIVSI